MTPIAILSDEHEEVEKGIVSPRLFPAVAIINTELAFQSSSRGYGGNRLDALIHAVEAFTSKNAYSISDVLARQAMKLIFGNIRKAYANGEDLEARANVLEGSLLAGMAFANAGVTAVHAFAYPIGAEFQHPTSGRANSIMLPPVMEFNMMGNSEKFAEMAEISVEPADGLNSGSVRARWSRPSARSPTTCDSERLREFGVGEHHIPGLAQGVMKVTRLLANNPRRITEADAQKIFTARSYSI